MYFKDRKEYERYLNKNEIVDSNNEANNREQNFFQWSDEGDILLTQSKCKKSMQDVGQYASCIGWILLDNGTTMALLKNSFGDIYRELSKEDYYIALYNNILMPQIARQLQNQSASYYFTKMAETAKKPKNNTRYIMTLDFKRKDDEFVSGNEILEKNQYNTTILETKKLLEVLEDYLIERGFASQDIERVKIDFIKQSFFNKLIQQLDEHNGNWGILVNHKENSVRMAPVYDLDCSCGIHKKSKKQRICSDSTTSIKSFLKDFSNETWFKQYIQEVIERFNLEKAFIEAEERTNVVIPKTYCEIYKNFFGQRIQEVRDVYYSLESEKKDEYER